MNKNTVKKGKQKGTGRWYDFAQKRKQVKESGIISTFEEFCFPQKEKRETRFFKKNLGKRLDKTQKVWYRIDTINIKGEMQMKTVLHASGKVVGTMLKIALIGVLLVVHLAANFIGLIVCAVTEG